MISCRFFFSNLGAFSLPLPSPCTYLQLTNLLLIVNKPSQMRKKIWKNSHIYTCLLTILCKNFKIFDPPPPLKVWIFEFWLFTVILFGLEKTYKNSKMSKKWTRVLGKISLLIAPLPPSFFTKLTIIRFRVNDRLVSQMI